MDYLLTLKVDAVVMAKEEEVDKAEEVNETVEEALEDTDEEVPHKLSVIIAINRDTSQTCAWTSPRQEIKPNNQR